MSHTPDAAIPYVVGSDAVTDYPAVSLELATLLDVEVAPCRCRMYGLGTITGFGPGSAAIAIGTVDYDTDVMADPTFGGVGRMICKTAGAYVVAGGILFGTGSGARQAYVVKNGTDTYGVQTLPMAAGGIQITCGEPILMAVNDYLQLYATAVSTPTDILGGRSARYLSAVRVSR